MQVAATALSMSEEELAGRVAEILDIPFQKRLSPVDATRFKEGVTLELFHKAGAFLYIEGGRVSGIASVDPRRAQALIEGAASLPQFISTWDEIERVIEKSYQELETRLEKEEVDASEDSIKLAAKVLSQILGHAEAANAKEVTLHLGLLDGGSYEFETEDKKLAKGDVNVKVTASLKKLSHLLSKKKGWHLFSDEAQIQTYRVTLRNSGAEAVFQKQVSFIEETIPPFESEIIEEISLTPKHNDEAPSSEEFDSNMSIEKAVEEATRAKVSKPNLVIIDDNQRFSATLQMFFRSKPYTVTCFSNGREALDAFHAGEVNPDVILCDLHMPEMNGMALLKELRSSEIWADVTVIILTSDEEDEAELSCVSTGADLFVKKSENLKKLRAYIDNFIARAERRKKLAA